MGEAEIPIVLDRQSPASLTAQLASQLRIAILNGLLQPEHTLPATRRMATELGISRGVVVRAFEQLSGEGFLESSGAGGTKVAVRPDIQTRPRKKTEHNSNRTQADSIDLTPGRPSGTPFKDREWRNAWKKALSEQGNTHLPPALGTSALREAVTRHLAVSRGLSVEPEDVIITGGTSDALQLVVAMLRSHADHPHILVEDPGYPTARRVMSAAGAQLLTVPVDENGLKSSQLAALSDIPDAVLITPSHQYPLGGRMAVQERLGLLKWADHHGVLVLEDDYDSEFRHSRMPLPAVASLPTNAEVVLLGTFSKNLSPWLRCGYLVVRGDAGHRLKAVREALDTPVAGVLQSALAHYIQEGGLARHVTRARREYSHRRAMLMQRLGFREDLELTALDGGLHAVIRFEQPDAADLAAKALQQGVRVTPLAGYYADRQPTNGLIIGYGAVTDLQLSRALTIISSLLNTTAEHNTRP
ncbi:GntR family transcriptional regulator/MocR family aminotransferase [Arthrobacter sp. V4I6]|uniref:MocR-like pyridoxine biosynthesis transcription factor PdxR n=1 Tax=unclassified Arthrobacter TaxID=235627 RepID=UPI002784E660|nr:MULTISPECIES: PLP-dependent aminotransferase family protein [unclassified Arthrobacter]MDQ0821016.1 GntR family transcriptional regulator/MocR family aminotransferase [Arthrobacter sp. V1I7]MDQ0855277.1 GntR family transcriptional regulator/MocR family aminotransferase [Arthrobacter sp. V4I6]